uniref:Uncharacterized protein n=1 Tax=Caenorhabditis japonica TaxID=281687 RepID=A0A8R1E7C8_CAEJA
MSQASDESQALEFVQINAVQARSNDQFLWFLKRVSQCKVQCGASTCYQVNASTVPTTADALVSWEEVFDEKLETIGAALSYTTEARSSEPVLEEIRKLLVEIKETLINILNHIFMLFSPLSVVTGQQPDGWLQNMITTWRSTSFASLAYLPHAPPPMQVFLATKVQPTP